MEIDRLPANALTIVTGEHSSGGSRKNIWGAWPSGPSSFGRQQRLSEITIKPIKNLVAGQDSGTQTKTAIEHDI